MHVFPIPFPIGARHYNQCKPVFSAECFRIADSTDISGLPFKTMFYLLRIRIKYGQRRPSLKLHLHDTSCCEGNNDKVSLRRLVASCGHQPRLLFILTSSLLASNKCSSRQPSFDSGTVWTLLSGQPASAGQRKT